jgi:hypothetical protein
MTTDRRAVEAHLLATRPWGDAIAELWSRIGLTHADTRGLTEDDLQVLTARVLSGCPAARRGRVLREALAEHAEAGDGHA